MHSLTSEETLHMSYHYQSWLNYVATLITQRIESALPPEPRSFDIREITAPALSDEDPVSAFIRKHNLTEEERVVLWLTLIPHLQPGFFDRIINEIFPEGSDYPPMGGVRGANFRGFIPTGETALFILAGEDPGKRLEVQTLFDKNHLFATNQVLRIEEAPAGEPHFSGRLVLSGEYLELFLNGKITRPKFSTEFPAEYITTELNSHDLVLPETTRRQMEELVNWVKYQDQLLNRWDIKRWVKPGFRALFHGPPGTGKTLSALIVGQETQKDVFRLDLSMLVSKYIGETEKNLARVFDKASNKEWILFFDEADALFGKRTNIRDAHDKYANQEVAYLLQRIESHPGLVILASNFKSNIDEAFIRRFQSVVYFPPPTPAERFTLWKKVMPANDGMEVPTDEELMNLSRKYDITGAGIVNVVHFCCLEAIASSSACITVEELRRGIEREYLKEGKVF